MSLAALAGRLAAFDVESLATLASKGLVRRAERDVASGLVRVLAYDEATETATVAADGESVRLDARGPVGAACTCPAAGACRHVLAAVLVVAAGAGAMAVADAVPLAGETASDSHGAGAPAEGRPETSEPLAEILALSNAEIAAWAGRSAMRLALAALATDAEPSLRIERASLGIRIAPGEPEVVWFAGRGLAGVASKMPAAKRKAAHAAAILTVRRANGIAPDAPGADADADVRAASAASSPTTDLAFLDDVSATLVAYLRTGFGAAPLALERRLGDLATSSRAEALPRLAALLRTLATRLREKRERTGVAEPSATLALLGDAFALAAALRAAARSPAPDDGRLARLRGRVRDEFEPLGDVRLVGVGGTLWTTRTGARGVTAYFYAPERERWFDASLARGSGLDGAFDPATAYRSESIWGAGSLADLSRAEVRLRGATASADGRLSLGKSVVATRAPLVDLATTIAAWPVAFDDWDAMLGYLRALAAPSLVAPRAERFVVLVRPTLAADPYADAYAQQLVWPLADARGRWLAFSVSDGAERDGFAQAIARLADRSRVPCVAAIARRDGPLFALRPFAVLRTVEPGATFESFGLDAPVATAGRDSLVTRLVKRAGDAVRGGAARFVPVSGAVTALERTLATAWDALVAIAELGGVDVATAHAERLARAGDELRTLGFDALGAALGRAANARGGDLASVVAAAHLVARAEALELRLPELVRDA